MKIKTFFLSVVSVVIIILLLRIVFSPTAEEYNKMGDSFYNKAEYKEAFENYKKAAQMKNGYAYYKIGILLKRNYITILDFKYNEEECFRKSAELACHEGQNEMGKLYLDKKDYANAFNFFNKAAEQGNKESATNLGKLFYRGLGTEKNIQEAIYWFNKSKDSDEYAKFYLAYIMFHEDEIALDSIKAFQYFNDAANSNIASSYNYLGLCYVNGIGTKIDSIESNKWFLKGAKANKADAQYNLGLNLSKGIGVKINKDEESMYWLLRSASLGFDSAIELVENSNISKIYSIYLDRKYGIYYSDTISNDRKKEIIKQYFEYPPLTYSEFNTIVRAIFKHRNINWSYILNKFNDNPLQLKNSLSYDNISLMVIKAPVHYFSSDTKYCTLKTYYGFTFKSIEFNINLVNNQCINEIYNIEKGDNVYFFGYISDINDAFIDFRTICLSRTEDQLFKYTVNMLYDIYCSMYINQSEEDIKLLTNKYGEYIITDNYKLFNDLNDIKNTINDKKETMQESYFKPNVLDFYMSKYLQRYW